MRQLIENLQIVFKRIASEAVVQEHARQGDKSFAAELVELQRRRFDSQIRPQEALSIPRESVERFSKKRWFAS